jgi:hypothetical protein
MAGFFATEWSLLQRTYTSLSIAVVAGHGNVPDRVFARSLDVLEFAAEMALGAVVLRFGRGRSKPNQPLARELFRT